MFIILLHEMTYNINFNYLVIMRKRLARFNHLMKAVFVFIYPGVL